MSIGRDAGLVIIYVGQVELVEVPRLSATFAERGIELTLLATVLELLARARSASVRLFFAQIQRWVPDRGAALLIAALHEFSGLVGILVGWRTR